MAQINKVKLPNGTTYDIVPSASDITVKSKLYFEAVSEDNVTYKKLVAEYVAPDPEDIDTTGTLIVYDLNGNTMFTMDMDSNRFNLLNVLHTLSAGTLSANNLTANSILVSDANKNIVSSSLSVSDLITTSNIGSQSVNYATSAGSATNANYINVADARNENRTPKRLNKQAQFIFSNKGMPNSSLWSGMHVAGWNSASENYNSWELVGPSHNNDQRTEDLFYRTAYNGTWGSWRRILTSSNYSSYALPLSGGTLKGTLNISGNYSYKLNNRASMYDLGTTIFGLCANGGATVRRYDNSNNYAGISANAFTNVSSRLIKKNIKDISDDEAKKILDLRIVDFDYEEIVGGETGQIGLIAEETIDIFPHCVKVPGNYNEETTKQQLSEGKVLDLLELDYSKLVAPLIKMVQIQQRQIEELKAEVEKLKDAIES